MSDDTYRNGVLIERRDDATRTVTTYNEAGTVLTTRPYTAAENTAADQAAAQAVLAANRGTLTATADLQARLTRLAAYKSDADLTAVLAQANNTALQTQVLNRALKALVRENQRQSATVALLVRLLDPALLATITDTTDTP